MSGDVTGLQAEALHGPLLFRCLRGSKAPTLMLILSIKTGGKSMKGQKPIINNQHDHCNWGTHNYMPLTSGSMLQYGR